MKSQICYQLASSVGVEFSERTMVFAPFSVREKAVSQFSLWCQVLQFLLICHWCGSTEGVSLSKSVCGFFKRNFLGLQKFYPLTQRPLVFATRSYGDLSSWHWNPGLGAWCGAGTPCSWDIPPEILFTTHGYGTSLFHVSAPPTSLDGCGFFNSVVVRLPFNSISDSSVWWLFYNLVEILKGLCQVATMFTCATILGLWILLLSCSKTISGSSLLNAKKTTLKSQCGSHINMDWRHRMWEAKIFWGNVFSEERVCIWGGLLITSRPPNQTKC